MTSLSDRHRIDTITSRPGPHVQRVGGHLVEQVSHRGFDTLHQEYGHRDQPARRYRLRPARTAGVFPGSLDARVVTDRHGGFGYVRGDFLRGGLFAVRLAEVAGWLAVAAACVLV